MYDYCVILLSSSFCWSFSRIIHMKRNSPNHTFSKPGPRVERSVNFFKLSSCAQSNHIRCISMMSSTRPLMSRVRPAFLLHCPNKGQRFTRSTYHCYFLLICLKYFCTQLISVMCMLHSTSPLLVKFYSRNSGTYRRLLFFTWECS